MVLFQVTNNFRNNYILYFFFLTEVFFLNAFLKESFKDHFPIIVPFFPFVESLSLAKYAFPLIILLIPIC